jgi:gamma-glutamylcyclotransferase (GGCT)/AIG2-like uncharacterized protein YtfP
MRGGTNHARLAEGRFVAPAETVSGWELRHMGRYPAMTPGEGTVKGEVWLVDAPHLAELDDFEEVPTLYERMGIGLAGQADADAWVMPAGRVAGFPRIDGGDWAAVTSSPAPPGARPPAP